MRRTTFDPTAGERARAIHAHPEIPRPTLDPTDPRYRERSRDSSRPRGGTQPVLDPTDPEYGRPLA